MSCEFLIGPSFPTLLQALVRRVSEGASGRALTSQWIVVPTPLLAREVREQLSRSADRPLMGVRVLPLLSLFNRLSSWLGPPRRSQRWSPAFDILTWEVLQRTEKPPLAGLKSFPNAPSLLQPTLLDLGDAGFGHAHWEILEELAAEGDLLPLESQLLSFYRDWLRGVSEWGLCWEPLHLQTVSKLTREARLEDLSRLLGGEEGHDARLLFYGFYDFTDVSSEILAALAEKIPVSVFFPLQLAGPRPHPAFAFSARILEDLRLRLGPQRFSMSVQGGQTATERFFLASFPEGPLPGRPDFLTVQYASGIQAECLSAAVQIRSWLDAEAGSLEPEEILVIAPRFEIYQEIFQETAARFAIPARPIDSSSEISREGRALRCLVRIWEELAPAEWVLAYFRDFPDAPLRAGVDWEAFEVKIRKLGIWGGESWRLLLQSPPESGPPGEEAPAFSPAERQLAEAVLAFWVDPPSRGGRRQSSFTPGEAEAFLRSVGEQWLGEFTPLQELQSALHSASSFRPALRIPQRVLTRLLWSAAGPAPARQEPPAGVRFGSLMTARGMTARAVILLGLRASDLPFRIEEDPLFSDASRLRLRRKAGDVGHRLSLKSAVSEEMPLLFHLVNTSATDRLHWVIPETDAQGKAAAPTPWVLRYLNEWGRSSTLPRLPRGPAEQAALLASLDPQGGRFLPPTFAAFLDPERIPVRPGDPYGYLLEAVRQRAKGLPAWNGLISLTALNPSAPATGRESGTGGPLFLSVTSLEQLARCPFRFYAQQWGRWQALEPLLFPGELSPLQWGRLLHIFLETVFRAIHNRGLGLAQGAELLLAADGEQLRKLAERLPQAHPTVFGGLPRLTERAVLSRLVQNAASYLSSTLESPLQRVPLRLEERYRAAFPGLEQVTISGKIDRMDSEGTLLRILDYKSGSCPAGLKSEVSMGQRLQPVLYPWLVRGLRNDNRQVAFSFVFLGDDPATEVGDLRGPALDSLVSSLRGLLERGAYPPVPTEMLESHGLNLQPCLHCEYVSACRRADPESHRRFPGTAALIAERLRFLMEDSQNQAADAERGTPSELVHS